MTERRAPTLTMKLASLYALGMVTCRGCRAVLTEGATEWDHIFQLAIDGPDVGDNLRPLCKPCHSKVTKAFARDRAHIRRLTGETPKRPGRKIRSNPKIPSRPFAKGTA